MAEKIRYEEQQIDLSESDLSRAYLREADLGEPSSSILI